MVDFGITWLLALEKGKVSLWGTNAVKGKALFMELAVIVGGQNEIVLAPDYLV
jgi:hypothetical protein